MSVARLDKQFAGDRRIRRLGGRPTLLHSCGPPQRQQEGEDQRSGELLSV